MSKPVVILSPFEIAQVAEALEIAALQMDAGTKPVGLMTPRLNAQFAARRDEYNTLSARLEMFAADGRALFHVPAPNAAAILEDLVEELDEILLLIGVALRKAGAK